MPKIPSVLTDTTVRQMPTKDKEQLIGDGGFIGLHIHIAKNTGRKSWRLRIRENGKIVKTEIVGSFEAKGAIDNLTVKEARIKADQLKQAYFHPESVVVPASVITFGMVVEEWKTWYRTYENLSQSTIKNHNLYLDNDILPTLKDLDIKAVNRDVCKKLLEAKFKTSPAGADKMKRIMNLIFDYASDNVDGAQLVNLKKIIKYKKLKVFVMPADLIAEYKKCDKAKTPVLRIACQLQHHVFLRSGELISALDENTNILHGSKWSEIDFKNQIWNVPAVRMKMKLPHTVPLSKQVIQLLNELKTITGETPFLFPSNRFNDKKAIVRDNLSITFRECGIKYYPHNCRIIASDWLKQNGIERDVVEIQLAHTLGNNVEQAYTHAPHLYFMEKRKAALQKWSDFLEPEYKSDNLSAIAETQQAIKKLMGN